MADQPTYDDLSATVAALTQERDAMQRRAEAAEADWQQCEAEVTRLSSALQQAQTWQPISSAPKDGRYVILGRTAAGRMPIDMVYVCRWDSSQPDWLKYPSCWVGWANEDFQPTHWMPLPAPPAGDAAPSTPNKR